MRLFVVFPEPAINALPCHADKISLEMVREPPNTSKNSMNICLFIVRKLLSNSLFFVNIEDCLFLAGFYCERLISFPLSFRSRQAYFAKECSRFFGRLFGVGL